MPACRESCCFLLPDFPASTECHRLTALHEDIVDSIGVCPFCACMRGQRW